MATPFAGWPGTLRKLILRLMPKGDRKSTRLNSSHIQISYAVFCLKKKIIVLWLNLVKVLFKVRCRLALLLYLISCLIWLDLDASLPLIKERILVISFLLHFLSLMLGSVLVLMLPMLVWLTPYFFFFKMLRKPQSSTLFPSPTFSK